MQNDPLNDAMSVMKNAAENGQSECIIEPSSKLIGRVLKVMQDNGYINQFEYIEDGKAGKFRVMMKGAINNCGVIKPRYSDPHYHSRSDHAVQRQRAWCWRKAVSICILEESR